MKTSSYLTVVASVAAVLMSPAIGFASDSTNCDKVAKFVREAVEKEPQKVLVIVEDNMVANESCACEIVKAAIFTTKANAELVKQIVQTAVHVAPNQAALIAECASAVARDHSKEVVDTVKGVTGVQPVDPIMAPIVEPSSESDYSRVPSDVRGVYLVSPSTGGVTTTTTVIEKPTSTKKVVRRRSSPHRSVPQSPSVATTGP